MGNNQLGSSGNNLAWAEADVKEAYCLGKVAPKHQTTQNFHQANPTQRKILTEFNHVKLHKLSSHKKLKQNICEDLIGVDITSISLLKWCKEQKFWNKTSSGNNSSGVTRVTQQNKTWHPGLLLMDNSWIMVSGWFYANKLTFLHYQRCVFRSSDITVVNNALICAQSRTNTRAAASAGSSPGSSPF